MSHYLGTTSLTTTKSFPRPSLHSGEESHNHCFPKFIGHYFVITGDFIFSLNCTRLRRKSEFAPLISSLLFFFRLFVSFRTFWVRRSAPSEKSSAPREGGWRGSSRKCLGILKKESSHSARWILSKK